MSAPDDKPPEWWTPPSLSADDMDAICRQAHAEQYASEQVATAQSEAAFAANQQEYSRANK